MARARMLRTRTAFLPPSQARLMSGLALAVAAPFVATPLARTRLFDALPAVVFLLAIVTATLVGRLAAALIAVIASVALLGSFVLPHTGPRAVGSLDELLALAAFAVASLLVAALVVRTDIARSDAEAARRRLAFLARASNVLNASLDYEPTLDDLAQLAVPQLADWCAIDLLDDDGALRNVAFAHLQTADTRASQARGRYATEPNARRDVRAVVRAGRAELHRSIPERLLVHPLDEADERLFSELGTASVIVAPLTARDRVFGTVTVVATESGRVYIADDLRLLEELGERAGLAIENARLHGAEATARQAAERARDRTEILRGVAAALAGARTPDEVADVLLHEGLEAVGATAGLVATVGPDEGAFQTTRSFGQPEPRHALWSSLSVHANAPLAQAIRLQQPVILETGEWPNHIDPRPDEADRLQDRAVAWLPMIASRRALGVIVATFPTPRRFDEAERQFMMVLALQGAQALERAQLFTERDHVARTLELSLAPPELPIIEGLELASAYRPMGPSEAIGGDFYDVFRIGPRRWGVLIGDVCGKGPAAAALTGLVRYTVRATAPFERRPSAVLARLNETMLSEPLERRFCTACYLELEVDEPDCQDGQGLCARVCCAGHPLPVVARADGAIESIGAPGELLGVFEQPRLVDVQAELHPSELLLLYTDGLTDPRVFEEGSPTLLVQRILERATGRTAADVIDRLCALLDTVALRDDVALLAIRRQGGGP